LTFLLFSLSFTPVTFETSGHFIMQAEGVYRAAARKSNEGYRKSDFVERVSLLIFLSRRKLPFKELEYLNGSGKTSAPSAGMEKF
jgi:hypothetical protein